MIPSERKEDRIDLMKMLNSGQVPKFHGDRLNYPNWREMFLFAVHCQPGHLVLKCMALVRALESSNPEVRVVAMGLSMSHTSYKATIIKLEKLFGGEERLMVTQLDLLRQMKPLELDNIADLMEFTAQLRRYKDLLQKQGVGAEFKSKYLFDDISKKLPATYVREFYRWRRDNPGPGTYDCNALLAWADRYIDETQSVNLRLRHTLVDEHPPSPAPKPSRGLGQELAFEPPSLHHHQGGGGGAGSKTANKEECECCKDGVHFLRECKQFIAMTPVKRREFCRFARRCYRCLRGGHVISDCELRQGCDQCARDHHPLLHNSRQSPAHNHYLGWEDPQESQSEQESEEEDERHFGGYHAKKASNCKATTALRTITVRAVNPRTEKTWLVSALLDDGSNKSVMSDQLATEMQLRACTVLTKDCPLVMSGVGGVVTTYASYIARIALESVSGDYSTPMVLDIIPTPTGNLAPPDWNQEVARHGHLADLQGRFPLPGRPFVDLIIGTDYPELHRALEERYPPMGVGPEARRGMLGWTVIGPHCGHTSSQHHNLVAIRDNLGAARLARSDTIQQVDPTMVKSFTMGGGELERLVERQWEVEQPPRRPMPLSKQERTAVNILESTTTVKNGKLTIGCLWNPQAGPVNNNEPLARKRLIAVEKSKSFLHEEEKQKYFGKIMEWVEKGYMRVVPTREPRPPKAYHMPHFPVFRGEEEGRKIRPVMDMAAKYKGNCLNDHMLTGPNMMQDLPKVLLRFRLHSVALTGDIHEMFLQIQLRKEDRPFHRLFTRDAQGQKVELESLTHVFGNPGSPGVAMWGTRKNAEKFQTRHPRAVEMILHSTIMDDSMDSFATIEEAAEVRDALVEIYANISMEIRKWASSHLEVLAPIPPEHRAKSILLEEKGQAQQELPTVKTLGMLYLAPKDTFSFEAPDKWGAEWTKRKILSTYMRVFDPLGVILPYIMQARMIFQDVWHRQFDWDQRVPDSHLQAWQKWIKECHLLPRVRLPRCLQAKGKEDQITEQAFHIFCDASELAYGAVAYLQTIYEEHPTTVVLAMSRARLAPMSIKSIPRLELMAAVHGLALAETLHAAAPHLEPLTQFWSDSQIVLSWIHSHSRCLTTFVGNRVAKIHEATSVSQWHFVDTHRNPADLVSRGLPLSKVLDSALWQGGPDFLRGTGPPPPPPKYLLTPEVSREVRKGMEYGVVNSFYLDKAGRTLEGDGVKLEDTTFPLQATMISSWPKLVTTTAWCLRANKSKKPPQLTWSEKQEAEAALWRKSQRESWRKSLAELEMEGRLTVQNPLATVRPKLDKMGLMRVNARLSTNTHLPESSRCPIILHKEHPTTQLIMRHTHENELHHVGGHATLLAKYNKKFYTPGATAMAKGIVKDCVKCRRTASHKEHQGEATLPDCRVQPEEFRLLPFHTTGVDAAGPFLVTRGRANVKRWILLFTCAQFRCVHLESMAGLDTDNFLNALSRFLARRPRPNTVYSDNAGAFTKAQQELEELLQQLDGQKIRDRFPDIHWKFNPPRAPHTGGFFERMVGAMKKALTKLLPGTSIGDEDFNTILCEVEGLLNSRPLSALPSNHPGDPEILTPAHFLMGDVYRTIAPTGGANITLERRWFALQDILDKAWAQFVEEIIPQMHEFNQWVREKPNLQIGDLVVLLEAKERGFWPIARVVDTSLTLRDGLVRRVVVRCKGKEYERSAHAVIRLQAITREKDQTQ